MTIEFAEYLSLSANSQGRNKSSYEHGDMERLALIRDMYERGANVDEIHLALKSGQKGGFDGFLQNTRMQLSESQIEQLHEIAIERDELRLRVGELERENARLQSKAEQLSELQAEIKELYKQIGRLEERLSKKED